MTQIATKAYRALPRIRTQLPVRAAPHVRTYADGTGRAGSGSGGGSENRGTPGTGGKGATGTQIAAAVGAGALVIVAAFYKWSSETPTSAGGSGSRLKAESVKGPEGDTTGVEPYAGSKLEQRKEQGKKSWTSTDMAKERNRPRSEKWHDDEYIRDEEGNPGKKIKSAAAIPNSQKTAKRVDSRTEG